MSNPKSLTTTYRGFRIAGDRRAEHSADHYSGGDAIVRADLISGKTLLWRAWFPDGGAAHASSTAWMSVDAAKRAVDREIEIDAEARAEEQAARLRNGHD